MLSFFTFFIIAGGGELTCNARFLFKNTLTGTGKSENYLSNPPPHTTINNRQFFFPGGAGKGPWFSIKQLANQAAAYICTYNNMGEAGGTTHNRGELGGWLAGVLYCIICMYE